MLWCSSRYVFMTRYFCKHRNNLIFTLYDLFNTTPIFSHEDFAKFIWSARTIRMWFVYNRAKYLKPVQQFSNRPLRNWISFCMTAVNILILWPLNHYFEPDESSPHPHSVPVRSILILSPPTRIFAMCVTCTVRFRLLDKPNNIWW